MSSILNELPIFDNLSESLKIVIKCFYVSKNKRSEKYFALLVTINDEVYGFGDNSFGKLGFGHNNDVNDWTLITQLCHQNVCQFFECFDCVFAKTSDNQMYGWGFQYMGTVGYG